MLTIRQIIKQAEELAENAGGAMLELSSPILEILFPIVLKKVLTDAAQDPGKLRSFFQKHSVTFAGGFADLPSGVMPEYFDCAEMYGTDESGSDISPVTYVPEYWDFQNPANAGAGIGFFTIRNGKIYAKNIPGETAAPTEGIFSFYAHTFPTVSTTPTDTLALDDTLTREFIVELARAARGEPPYQDLGEEEKEK